MRPGCSHLLANLEFDETLFPLSRWCSSFFWANQSCQHGQEACCMSAALDSKSASCNVFACKRLFCPGRCPDPPWLKLQANVKASAEPSLPRPPVQRNLMASSQAFGTQAVEGALSDIGHLTAMFPDTQQLAQPAAEPPRLPQVQQSAHQLAFACQLRPHDGPWLFLLPVKGWVAAQPGRESNINRNLRASHWAMPASLAADMLTTMIGSNSPGSNVPPELLVCQAHPLYMDLLLTGWVFQSPHLVKAFPAF